MNCNFLLNAGNMIQIWIIVILLYPFILLLAHFLPQVGIFKGWRDSYEYSVFLRAGIGSFIDLSLSSFLQVLRGGLDNYIVGIATMAAIATIAWIVFFPFYVANTVNRPQEELEDKSFKRKYGGLYEELKLDRAVSKNYIVMLVVRRIILSFCFVFLHDYPAM